MTNALILDDVNKRVRDGIQAETDSDCVTEEELWALKRARQTRDLEAMRSGRRTQEEMMWFSGGRTKHCKIPGTPY